MVSWSPLTFSFLPHSAFLSSVFPGSGIVGDGDFWCLRGRYTQPHWTPWGFQIGKCAAFQKKKRKKNFQSISYSSKANSECILLCLHRHPLKQVWHISPEETLLPQSGDNCRIADPTVGTSCRSLRLNWCRLWLHNSAQLVAGGSRNIAAFLTYVQ